MNTTMPSDVGKLKIAWISDFPVEWSPMLKDEFAGLPKRHHATWLGVLLAELIQRSGLELHILVLGKQFKRPVTLQRQGVTFHCVKTRGGFRAPSLYWSDTLLIRSRLKHIQPDLVHAWGSENGASLVASRLKVPCLVTLQGLLSWLGDRVPLKAYERLNRIFESWSLNRARYASAESRFSVGYIKNRYPDLRVFHIEHAPNPIFHRVERKPEPGRFIFVGTFMVGKGADLLVEALDEIRHEYDFELTVVGTVHEGLCEKIRRRVSSEIWDRIVFVFEQDPAYVVEALSRAQLMIMPTRADTGPVAVKEAVVAGVPVVASSIGGIPDYVVEGKNGMLFPAGNLEAMIRCLKQAMEHPLFSRGQVDEATLIEKRHYLSAGRMADGFIQAYRDVLSEETAPRPGGSV